MAAHQTDRHRGLAVLVRSYSKAFEFRLLSFQDLPAIPHSTANAKQRISDQRTTYHKANLVPARATHYCTCKQYWSFPCS